MKLFTDGSIHTVNEISREADGHTYYRCQTGHWVGVPTNVDHTLDLENVSYVTDFKEYMSPEDYRALTDWLDENDPDQSHKANQ